MGMSIQEIIVQILVVSIFGLWAYSAVKKQSIKDTIDQIKDFIDSFKEE